MKAVVVHKYGGPEGKRSSSWPKPCEMATWIPISETLPLRQAAEAQATAEKGVAGKILLVA